MVFHRVKHKRLSYYTDGVSVKIEKNDLLHYRLDDFELNFLKPFGFIYKILNLENNKIYIGQTIQNPFKRFSHHLFSSRNNKGSYIHRAINKYGETNFEFEVIKSCSCQGELNIYEEYFINKYKTLDSNFGYNIAKVSFDGSNPMKDSSLFILWTNKYGEEIAKIKLDEFKEKQRILATDSISTKNLSFKDHKHSDESKKKLSDKRLGENNPMYGKCPYGIWVEKYGKEEANIRQNVCLTKRKETRDRNKLNEDKIS